MARNPFIELSKRLKIIPFSTEEIVLDHAELSEIGKGDLKHYPNLQHLYIPHNKLKNLNNLDYNIRLTFIDARCNEITEFDLSKQEFLVDLYLAFNKLQDLEHTISKLVHIRNLSVLDLRGNPLTLEKGYRNTVIHAFPSLKVLDGVEITLSDRKRIENPSRDISKSKRPASILQCLKERPMSSAEYFVYQKATTIRSVSEMKQRKVNEEMTAISRQRKEEFEKAASIKTAPFAEGLDFLSKNAPKVIVKSESSQQKRPHTRAYIKRPVYTKAEYFFDEEKRMNKLNPDLPPIIFRFDQKITFPSS